MFWFEGKQSRTINTAVQGGVKGSQMCFAGSGERKGNTSVAKLKLAEMSAFVESAILGKKKI